MKKRFELNLDCMKYFTIVVSIPKINSIHYTMKAINSISSHITLHPPYRCLFYPTLKNKYKKHSTPPLKILTSTFFSSRLPCPKVPGLENINRPFPFKVNIHNLPTPKI